MNDQFLFLSWFYIKCADKNFPNMFLEMIRYVAKKRNAVKKKEKKKATRDEHLFVTVIQIILY